MGFNWATPVKACWQWLVGNWRIGWREGAFAASINASVDESTVESIGVVFESGFGPFKESKSWAVGEFVKHTSGDKFRKRNQS